MNAYLVTLFILLFILLFVFLSFSHVKEDEGWISAWRDFSFFVGLVYEPGTTLKPALMMGTYRSYFVKIELGWAASFESGALWKYTRITLDLGRRSNGHFFLGEKGLIDKWRINRRGKESFDNLFTIKGKPVGLVNQVLDTNDIRHRLIQIHPSHLQVGEEELLFYSNDNEKDAEKVKFLMDLLCDIAKMVTNNNTFANYVEMEGSN